MSTVKRVGLAGQEAAQEEAAREAAREAAGPSSSPRGGGGSVRSSSEGGLHAGASGSPRSSAPSPGASPRNKAAPPPSPRSIRRSALSATAGAGAGAGAGASSSSTTTNNESNSSEPPPRPDGTHRAPPTAGSTEHTEHHEPHRTPPTAAVGDKPGWQVDLEEDLKIIRKFQGIAQSQAEEKERAEQEAWTPERRAQWKADKERVTEHFERVYFGRDTPGVKPDETSFDVESNLDNIDGIGHFLERLHSLEREAPYRIPKGW